MSFCVSCLWMWKRQSSNDAPLKFVIMDATVAKLLLDLRLEPVKYWISFILFSNFRVFEICWQSVVCSVVLTPKRRAPLNKIDDGVAETCLFPYQNFAMSTMLDWVWYCMSISHATWLTLNQIWGFYIGISVKTYLILLSFRTYTKTWQFKEVCQCRRRLTSLRLRYYYHRLHV